MSEIVDRIVAILVGPGAACFMTKPDAESDAREILRAIREPTQAMLSVPVELFQVTSTPVSAHVNRASVWRAMIDEALRE